MGQGEIERRRVRKNGKKWIKKLEKERMEHNQREGGRGSGGPEHEKGVERKYSMQKVGRRSSSKARKRRAERGI